MGTHRGAVAPVYVGPYGGAVRVDSAGHEVGHVREEPVAARVGGDEHISQPDLVCMQRQGPREFIDVSRGAGNRPRRARRYSVPGELEEAQAVPEAPLDAFGRNSAAHAVMAGDDFGGLGLKKLS